ncbi:COX15/CtaA family protein [Nonomuraea jabiensis]|uniref:COX15/CtaA family protein n=1 Tax=Nonomuraea jabiensis TaxID=882448 RepID=UPI003446761B
MTTPFQWLATRVSFERAALRRAAAAGLATSVMIILTGGIVRVTGSGLGCDGWPNCSEGSFAATPEMGVHAAIEFSNRLLTGVVCAAVGWLIVVARLQRRPVPALTRWGWVQFWIVILNAVVGGITVWARLSPYIVAAHFLAAVLFRVHRGSGAQLGKVPLVTLTNVPVIAAA